MSDNTVLDRQEVTERKIKLTAKSYEAAVNDPSIETPSVDSASVATPNTDAPVQDRSPYLVKRLLETNERNLFNHVKFNLVKQQIDQLGIDTPRVLDIGCGLQVAHSYLTDLNLKCPYLGVDYEPNFSPGAVVDLLNIEFKLPHLHYPEHKIRLTQQEWVQIIAAHFDIEFVRGFGYLSVIPYLPMASKRYTPDNRLGKMFNYLRGRFFEWGPFKPIDLGLSKILGRIPGIKNFSNDIIIVARPRK